MVSLATCWVIAISCQLSGCIGWDFVRLQLERRPPKLRPIYSGWPKYRPRCWSQLWDVDDPNSPRTLEDDLQELFQAERRLEIDEIPFQQEELRENAVPDLNSLQRQMETLSASMAFPNYESKSEQEEDNNDGFYLAPDIYQRSRDLLRGDGSLDLGSVDVQSPEGRSAILERLLQSELASNPVPSDGYQEGNREGGEQLDDWNQLWAAAAAAKGKPLNASQSEELHRQVFQNEEAYLQQTERFRRSLTDPTMAEKTTYERRSAQYQNKQAQAMERLNQNMREFEPLLLQRKRPGSNRCSKCSVQLAEEDHDVTPQLWMQKQNMTQLCRTCYKDLTETSRSQPKFQTQRQETTLPNKRDAAVHIAAMRRASRMNNPPEEERKANPTFGAGESNNGRNDRRTVDERPTTDISSWTGVTDPDTGEVFYWNEEEDEIRWEI